MSNDTSGGVTLMLVLGTVAVFIFCGCGMEWARDIGTKQRTKVVARAVCGEDTPYKWEDTPQGGVLRYSRSSPEPTPHRADAEDTRVGLVGTVRQRTACYDNIPFDDISRIAAILGINTQGVKA